jgi:hypothetical protein
MKIREKNLEMRYNLSFLIHCHSINRPYVFSYYSFLNLYKNQSRTTVTNNENENQLDN